MVSDGQVEESIQSYAAVGTTYKAYDFQEYFDNVHTIITSLTMMKPNCVEWS